MQIVLVILIVALVLKDISYIGDPYIMRGTAQTLCLLVGGLWLMQHFSVNLLTRYWVVIAYLVTLVLATYGTTDPIYVTLQVVSLAAIIIFGIAYFESRNKRPSEQTTNTTLITTTVVMYGAIAWLSLVAAHYWPSIAYQDIDAGNITGIQTRFRGLFSQAGMMGTAAGLLVVLTLFGLRRFLPKLIFVLPGLICLAMTASRTYWVASVVAVGLTGWSYYKRGRIWIFAATAAGLFVVATVAAFDIQFDTKGVGKTVRVKSVSNLAGRLELWERAFKAFKAHPYLGYGFTAGAVGLMGDEEARSGAIAESPALLSRDMGRTTMHNGYVQSLLDSGVVGTAFYVLVIVVSIRAFYKYDSQKAFPAEFAALIFLAIANLSENAIYSASVFSSILFWIFALFAFSLSSARRSFGEATNTGKVPAAKVPSLDGSKFRGGRLPSRS